jgi:hypothetical protein
MLVLQMVAADATAVEGGAAQPNFECYVLIFFLLHELITIHRKCRCKWFLHELNKSMPGLRAWRLEIQSHIDQRSSFGGDRARISNENGRAG